MSFNPASRPSLKCSSASASFPGGLPFSLTMNLTVTFEVDGVGRSHLSSSGTVLWWFLHDLRNPTARPLEDVRSRRAVEAPEQCAGRDRRSLPGATRDGPAPLAKRRRLDGTEPGEDQQHANRPVVCLLEESFRRVMTAFCAHRTPDTASRAGAAHR